MKMTMMMMMIIGHECKMEWSEGRLMAGGRGKRRILRGKRIKIHYRYIFENTV
jgi:hypothetical protein